MEKILNKLKDSISDKEKEKIINEYLNDYVISKFERNDREFEVLLDKVEIHTEGKDIVLENTSTL